MNITAKLNKYLNEKKSTRILIGDIIQRIQDNTESAYDAASDGDIKFLKSFCKDLRTYAKDIESELKKIKE